jgi:S1-C subfamily serine protease
MNCDNGAGKIRAHDGFLVRDFGLFGMSGGPVFDKAGTVIGMQGSVTAPRVSEGAGGRKITVENAAVIRSGLILELLEKNHIRHNVLGRF